MKTKMFKKLDNGSKAERFKRILKKRTNYKLPEDICRIISTSVDIENQYQINFHGSNKESFKEAAILQHTRTIKDETQTLIKEEAVVLTGAIRFGYEIYTQDYNHNTLTDMETEKAIINDDKICVFKKAKNTIVNDVSEWFYSIEIYVPEK